MEYHVYIRGHRFSQTEIIGRKLSVKHSQITMKIPQGTSILLLGLKRHKVRPGPNMLSLFTLCQLTIKDAEIRNYSYSVANY